jgi:hypothetical protein
VSTRELSPKVAIVGASHPTEPPCVGTVGLSKRVRSSSDSDYRRRRAHDDDRTEDGTSPKCLTWVGPCYPSSASSTDDLRLGLHEGRSSTELRWSPTITHADTMRHTRGGKLRWAGRAGAMNCAPTRLTPRHIHPHTADTMRRRALWGYYPCRRHEFVGNPGESEVRAHLRGQT